jgi:hypothetical protein
LLELCGGVLHLIIDTNKFRLAISDGVQLVESDGEIVTNHLEGDNMISLKFVSQWPMDMLQ